MDEIENKTAGTKRYKLNINPADYGLDPRYGANIELQQAQVFVDGTSAVNVDCARLMQCFQVLRSKDFKYYYYILSKLVRNDEAIKIDFKEMREFSKDKLYQSIHQGIGRLITQGLIIRAPHRNACFLVNPLFAWKGNRADYINVSALPVVSASVAA